MEIREVWKNYAPNFMAGIMTAILISIIVGVEPADIANITIILWTIGLYLIGLFLTWLVLSGYD